MKNTLTLLLKTKMMSMMDLGGINGMEGGMTKRRRGTREMLKLGAAAKMRVT